MLACIYGEYYVINYVHIITHAITVTIFCNANYDFNANFKSICRLDNIITKMKVFQSII